MKQEDKDLLLKDLCARLPYKVIIQVKEYVTLDTELKIGHINRLQNDDIVEIKPYLRPMSSMTEVEKHIFDTMTRSYTVQQQASLFDWLNAHHFDYRGLIDKGLAIAVTKENNPYKE